jgi:hypothetical protein
MTEGHPGAAAYEERIPVPLPIWLAALGLWALFAVAMAATFGSLAGLVLFALGAGGIGFGLHSATGVVAVADGHLSAGRARLPLAAVGTVVPLDAAAARVLRGTGADGRAYLFLRSWVPTAARVDVSDPDDPAPYWYVSTRHPDALAAAVSAARP